jgi:hypothetical protein
MQEAEQQLPRQAPLAHWSSFMQALPIGTAAHDPPVQMPLLHS